MKASVRLWPSYNEKLVAYRNTNFRELKALFDTTQRLILEQSLGLLLVSTMIWRFTPWMRSTLCYDQVTKWARAKVCVYSDSVLCPEKMFDHSEANAKGKSQLEDFQQTNAFREFFGINGEQLVRVENFPELTSLDILQKRSMKI